ncbi:MAG TPA: ABC transporter permease [Gaiellales bacterium]|nr:ABC transporter permease [Gaiellales bacterium]
MATAALDRPAAGRSRVRASPYWLLLLPLLVPLVLLYLVPLGRVLWISFTDPTPGLANYERLLAFPALQRVLFTTLRIGAITTGLALLLGYLVAYVMVHAGPRHRLWVTAFVLVPFWVSLLVRAFAWLTLLRTEGVINQALLGWGLIAQPLALVHNELGVVIGMVHYMVPYATLPLYANMQGIDPRLADASRSLGAGPLTTFLRIFLPLSLPGIAAAGVLVFIFSLGFFVTPALLGGGRVVMIAEYVSVQILQTVRWGVGTMMASVLLLTVVLLLLAMSRVVDLRRLFGAR